MSNKQVSNKQSRRKNATGFTLIELLVVISIIALLLSILMPALTRARVAARRVICAGRIKQIIAAAVASAAENRQGFLPWAGIRKLPTMPDYVRDDATMLTADQYFRIGASVAGMPGGDFAPLMSTSEVDSLAQRIHNGNLDKLFVCPERENKGDQFPQSLPSQKNKPGFPPVLMNYWEGRNPPLWAARLGYLYFGGMESGNWEVAPRPPANHTIERWRYRSPIKLSDNGTLVLMTDPNWFWPSMRQLTITHTARGFAETKALDLRQVSDARRYFPSSGTNIGRLDGAVEYKILETLSVRPIFYENKRPVVGVDLFTFF